AGPDVGKTLSGREKVLVGKGSESTFQLKDEEVSRVHLELEPMADGIRVRDRPSTNGTFLAGARIQQMTVFEEAMISLGSTVLRVALVVPGAPKVARSSFGKVIGRSAPMLALYEKLEKAAPTESTVVLLGETGT